MAPRLGVPGDAGLARKDEVLGRGFADFDRLPDIPDREERVAAGTQALAHRFEEIIRGAPTQWHLLQPNWPSDREGAG